MMQSRRQYQQNPQAFVDDFLKTLMPGVIPRANFIDWDSIQRKMVALQEPLEFYIDLARRDLAEPQLLTELRDALLSADNPAPLVKCAFELLGHTNPEFVTRQDDLDQEHLARDIQRHQENRAADFAAMLNDLGFRRLLARNDLVDLLLGVQVGLETHRRKNIGGEEFRVLVRDMLRRICAPMALAVQEEQVLTYGKGLSKKVDFALLQNGRQRVGIEVNFYTVSGSKPTEIKRSYGGILRAMENQERELVWITDGKGYRSMCRSLRDAVVTFPNVYNLHQLEQHFSADLQAMLNQQMPQRF